MKNICLRFLALIALLSSCHRINYIDSDKVVQANILQTYHIHFDAETQTFTSYAIFHIDNMSGDIIQLTNSSFVSCFDKKMTLDKGYYTLTINETAMPQDVPFVYQDNEGAQYVNKLNFKKIDTPSDQIKLTLGQPNSLSYSGEKATEDDLFFLLIYDDTKVIEIEASEVHDQQLLFSAEDLSVLSVGSYRAQLLRRWEGTDVLAADRGGFRKSEYLSVIKQVTIK